ncbi:hypothetical protein D3C76_1601500 [compost metagenome]
MVDTRPPIEEVIAGAADDGIGHAITHPHEVACAGKAQVLEGGRERVARQAGSHQVGTPAQRFSDDVCGIVDDKGVVTGTANQGICTEPTVKCVVASVAGKCVIT